MRRIALLVLLAWVSSGCRWWHRRHPHARHAASVAGPAFRIPYNRLHPGLNTPTEHDVPLSWIYLPDDPASTGSAPNALVGAVLPCGFHAIYASVTPPGPTLGLRLRAMLDRNHPVGAQCEQPPTTVQYVSLQRLRLGTYTVTDATPHGPADPPVPSVTLHVVADDATLPPATVRQARGCDLADDATCTGGGFCTTPWSDGRSSRGVCVPPQDPAVAVGRPCAAGTARTTLHHANGADVQVCLTSCDATHACAGATTCAPVAANGAGVCLPNGVGAS